MALVQFNGDKYRALNQIKEKKIYLFGVEFIDVNVGKWVVKKTL